MCRCVMSIYIAVGRLCMYVCADFRIPERRKPYGGQDRKVLGSSVSVQMWLPNEEGDVPSRCSILPWEHTMLLIVHLPSNFHSHHSIASWQGR